jgi:vacuolar-type H+-ATPase subunit I/STV1
MTSDEVLHKDVVVALLEASAALVGFILVFVGLVVGAYGALAGDTPHSIKARLRRTAGLTLIPFSLGLLQITTATIWLLDQLVCLYVLNVGLFIATVVALAGAAFWTLRELVWD